MAMLKTNKSDQRRPCHTNSLYKWLVASASLLAVAQIWFAPYDNDDFRDPSFDSPAQGARNHHRRRGRAGVAGDSGNTDSSLEKRQRKYLAGVDTDPAGEAESDSEAATGVSEDATHDTAHGTPTDTEDTATGDDPIDDTTTSELFGEAPQLRTSKNSSAKKRLSKYVAEAEKGSSDVGSDSWRVTGVSADATRDTTNIIPSVSDDTATRLVSSNDTHKHDMLVEALQPITFKDCCMPFLVRNKPGVLKKKGRKKFVECFGTCYTERACTDPLYPFNSEEEKAMFPMGDLPHTYNRTLLSEECKSPEQMRPPVDWCQTPHVDKKNGTAAYLVEGFPPAGCSKITHGGGAGAFQHVIIFPSAKLAFCGIPKVGITQWEQFLRFYIGAKDYPAFPHFKMDRNFFLFDNLAPAAQRRIWEDEDWTWAATIREPAERLLSAFLDKMKSRKELTFEKFVDSLAPSNVTHCDDSTRSKRRGKSAKSDDQDDSDVGGLNWCTDPHWRPQVYSCGLSERLDRFQFIGELHQTPEQTRELLGHVGLWESYGKNFINGGVRQRGFEGMSLYTVMSHPFTHTHHVGFQQKNEATNTSAAEVVYGHAKGSQGKMDRYFTPQLLKKVREDLYADDYKLWQLVKDKGAKLSKGSELAARLSEKCRGAPVVMPLP